MATELRWNDPVTPENEHITIRRGMEDEPTEPVAAQPEPEPEARTRVSSPSREAASPEPTEPAEAPAAATPEPPAKKDKTTQ
jgi:hypothetical protein